MAIAVFMIAAIIAAFALQRYILANTLKNVYYSSQPSKDVVEPEEEFQLLSEIRNEKWMPELYIRVSERLPADAGITDETQAWSRKTFYMKPYQRILSSVPISLNKRGRYILHGAMLTGGDFFGTKTKIQIYNQEREIVVIPKRTDAVDLDKMMGGFLGDLSVRRFIMPDPVLTIGVREYTGTEPQKDISWAQSARAGHLLVKRYDHTLEIAAAVMLNLRGNTETSPEAFEECLSLCRVVCEQLERRGIKYSFYTNAVAVGSVRLAGGLVDGLGQGHLLAVLEWLGRSSMQTVREDFEKILQKAIRKAEQGRFHIIITPEQPDGAIRQMIERLRIITGGEALVITPKNQNGGF